MKLAILDNIYVVVTGRVKPSKSPLDVSVSFEKNAPEEAADLKVQKLVEFSSVATFKFNTFDRVENEGLVRTEAYEVIKHALYGEILHELKTLKHFMWNENCKREGNSMKQLNGIINELENINKKVTR